MPTIPTVFEPFLSMKPAQAIAQTLPADMEKVVTKTLIWVSPNSLLKTENIATSAVIGRNPMNTLSNSLRNAVQFMVLPNDQALAPLGRGWAR
jgi:hypothetical protein